MLMEYYGSYGRFSFIVNYEHGSTFKQLGKLILFTLHKFGLEMNLCWGQAYESAEKIEGLRNGAAKRIYTKYFKLSYSFCQS